MIGDIGLEKGKSRVFGRSGDVSGVPVGEVVDTDNFKAVTQESVDQMAADKARRTRHHRLHQHLPVPSHLYERIGTLPAERATIIFVIRRENFGAKTCFSLAGLSSSSRNAYALRLNHSNQNPHGRAMKN
ncbi:hypothetical protein [Azospirillum oleiclasticum]|uniref:hypothetical protein n=1 Tax=Azospirillum oleiclasticum TaxID=2735135 RepID=UPI001FE5FBB9|nr:hypothetical protein [Azospirillum oleiclasticum]